MVTPKTWTANDIEMGVMRLHHKADNLSLMQGYIFIDEDGIEIEALPKKSIVESVVFTALTAEIQSALSILNGYL